MGKHGEKVTSSDKQNIIKEDSKKKAEKAEKIESKELKQNKKRKKRKNTRIGGKFKKQAAWRSRERRCRA